MKICPVRTLSIFPVERVEIAEFRVQFGDHLPPSTTCRIATGTETYRLLKPIDLCNSEENLNIRGVVLCFSIVLFTAFLKNKQ